MKLVDEANVFIPQVTLCRFISAVHCFTVNEDFTFARFIKTAHDLQQCRLA